ncbi:alpha-L-fucosidase [Pseudoxanthomonas sp. CF125]|uniref:alpha-L-fucosidase n=1 Tax=Pseudoxanthomonas sp. CF125 TaxID=1855303 RepID=UPI00088A18D6|nr:alpha-L-fucosidase [Pseudoxanthomonas sp. CF125]SDQ32444.1 alpha-L-fucosidase [Pseudoxanthomonas sp. CF125]
MKPSQLLHFALAALMPVAVLTSSAAFAQTRAHAPVETAEQKAERLQWWTDARFGMFIHWGLFTVPAGEWKEKDSYAEWIMDDAYIPRAEYEQIAKQFNPVKYDPDEWARIAKGAGMKYIVFTSKHHEGFAMWDTKATDYNIAKRTPYGKGVLKELAEATRRQGLHFGTYYSIMDWHHPSQSGEKQGHYNPTTIDPKRKREYIDEMKAELKELVTETGTEILWFDGEWLNWWTNEDGRELYAYLHSLNPNLIINNRIGKGRDSMQGMDKGEGVGDFGTPEQEIPPLGYGPGVYWESCMTLNDHWGFIRRDHNWKSPKTIVRNLIDVASKGGNYLLNVGPTAEGLIPQPSVERLAEVGKWMKVNGESIYGTQASPFAEPVAWGRVTSKPGKLYLHVFDWPKDGRLALPAGIEYRRAYLLAEPDRTLKMRKTRQGVRLSVPASAPDSVASVIVVETAQTRH